MTAQLAKYEAARSALAEAHRVDECKDSVALMRRAPSRVRQPNERQGSSAFAKLARYGASPSHVGTAQSAVDLSELLVPKMS